MLVIVVVFGPFAVLARLQHGAFDGFTLGGFALAQSLVILVGIEHEMQPRHHLLDRRQRPARTGFAARAGRALRAGLALRARLAARALRPGLALRTRLAARTFRSGPSGMALRTRTTRLAACALRPLPSLPNLVRHARTPDQLQTLP
ncbi:hypothetical protein [Bradyrhizobium erythrophlei]|uniref:Uncharacterized protein n=1 Tax=Bradyrhizobium erythrophlei TaxID=1437360 RepID=A0A1M5H081_9BRAD|nr:hypothetical protein SAMN05444169_0494 [Bradyrhizobium erythrophlei]